MKQLTLSIVIPVYNEEDYISACLKSIAEQTKKPLEVIVVDNNSTDKTASIAKKFKFVTLLHESNQGVQAARNTGFDRAKGDIIGRIDADTRLTEEWVQITTAFFEKDVEIMAISGPTGWYDMPLKRINYWADAFFKAPIIRYSKKFYYLFGANMALRRTAWQKVSKTVCSRQDISEDHDLAIHLHQLNQLIVYNPKLLVHVSSRRIDDKPQDFYRYLWAIPRAYSAHGIKTLSPYIAILGYSLGYFNFQFFRYTIDPKTQVPTLKYLLIGNIVNKRHAARKDPMAS